MQRPAFDVEGGAESSSVGFITASIERLKVVSGDEFVVDDRS